MSTLPQLTVDDEFESYREQVSHGVVVLAAPVDGEVVPIPDFPDYVFAQGLLGIGVGFLPTSNQVLAPAAGRVISIFPGRHAVLMKTPEGLELLIHIGLDTVDLDGKGFDPLVKYCQEVRLGQPLIKFDPAVIRQEGKELHTAVIVTNKEAVDDYTLVQQGHAVAGRTPILSAKLT